MSATIKTNLTNLNQDYSKKNYYSNSSSSTSNSSDKSSNNPNNCKHNYEVLNKFFNNRGNNENSEKIFEKICFCSRCRGLIININENQNLYTISQHKTKTTKDYINPLLFYYQMKKNDNKGNLSYINNYNKKRRDMISFLAKLRNKYKISYDSFFLSINLLDIVSSKLLRFDVDLELLTIGCFFLAGKFLENDAYLGDFQNLSANFKRIFYSSEEMQKSEIFCLNLLNFDLSRITAKQYFDIFCSLGFVFDDELNNIKDLSELYESGIKILREVVSDFQSTYFSNLSIAFSVLRYLREANNLEKSNKRISLLEKIFDIKPSFYHGAWELLKKLKNFIQQSSVSFSEKYDKSIHLEILTQDREQSKKNSDKQLSFNKNLISQDLDDPNAVIFRSNLSRDRVTSSLKQDETKSNNKITTRSSSLLKDNIKSLCSIDAAMSNQIPSKEEDVLSLIYNSNLNSKKILNGKIKVSESLKNLNNENNIENGEKIISRINQQLKSITTKKLISINSGTTMMNSFNISNKADKKCSEFNTNLDMVSSYNFGKTIHNNPFVPDKNIICDSKNKKINIDEKKVDIAAPIRRSSKIIEENLEIKPNDPYKRYAFKRKSVDNLPIANLATKTIEINVPMALKLNEIKLRNIGCNN